MKHIKEKPYRIRIWLFLPHSFRVYCNWACANYPSVAIPPLWVKLMLLCVSILWPLDWHSFLRKSWNSMWVIYDPSFITNVNPTTHSILVPPRRIPTVYENPFLRDTPVPPLVVWHCWHSIYINDLVFPRYEFPQVPWWCFTCSVSIHRIQHHHIMRIVVFGIVKPDCHWECIVCCPYFLFCPWELPCGLPHLVLWTINIFRLMLWVGPCWERPFPSFAILSGFRGRTTNQKCHVVNRRERYHWQQATTARHTLYGGTESSAVEETVAGWRDPLVQPIRYTL